jgi:putative SOS response-associated peptidase YedK
MCNDYEQQIAWADYCKAMQAEALKLPARQGPHDLPAAGDVRIGDTAPVMRLVGDEVELVPMRFGMPPARPKGAPLFNWKSEGRSFANSKRCLIPASAFFEFTGSKYPKAKHRFTLNDGPFMAIAGVWRPGEGNQPGAFAMLTTAPGPDVAPVHGRQIAVLRPEDWSAWLTLSKPEAELLKPLPVGSLTVEMVRTETA